MAKPGEKTGVLGFLRKVWQYRKLLIVEPLLLCWLLPAVLLQVTVQNLAFEKACRVNLGYDAHVCVSMLDKELYGIDCDQLNLSEDGMIELMPNATQVFLDYNATSTQFNNTIEIMDINDAQRATEVNKTIPQVDLNYTVCRAEIETQKQVTTINAIRGPMSSIFPLIVILFAGGWSDRNRIRKPCMLFPMIGELLSMIGLLITSIYMDYIPMEFGAIIERVVPSMLGGSTLMIMGIYSYLTEITDENDRAFRFGIFAVCANIIQLVGTPFSGTLHIQLGYVKMCIIGACILFLGILYIIFFIPEVKKSRKNENSNGNTNGAFEADGVPVTSLDVEEKKIDSTSENKGCRKDCLSDFFNPISVYEFIQVFTKKRADKIQLYLILLIVCQLLFIAPAIGEGDYIYNFQLKKLQWNGEMFSYYNTYSAALNIVGTFLMTAVLIKFFKLSDSMGGFIASLGTVISKPILAFSKEAVMYYIGTTIDLFISCKAIAVKSIVSNFVESEELGRLYSVLGVTEAIGGFIFSPIYSQIYASTLENFVGAFYIFSDIFLIPTLFIFIAIYFYLKKQNKNKSDAEENDVDKEIESTRV